MRALVTGLNGFVGAHLKTALHTQGWDVYGISKEPPFDATTFESDLLDTERLTSIVQDVHPDAVFHLAGISSVKFSWDHPDLTLRVNRDGTESLYGALATLTHTPTVLLVSSAEVYGIPDHTPLVETDPLNPNNPYAESKRAAELVATRFPAIRTITARSFPHIGPGQRPGFIVPDVAQQIVAIERGGVPELLIGNTDAQRDFTDVRDVVEAYVRLVNRGTPGQIYNVCSGVAHRIADIVTALMQQAAIEIHLKHDPARMRPSDIPILLGDNTKIRTATHWAPQISIERSLSDVLAYYRTLS